MLNFFSLILKKNKYILFTLTLFCYSYFYFLLGYNAKFYGDEIFTLDIAGISKPITYKFIVSNLIYFIEHYSLNTSLLKLSSIFFSSLAFFVWYFYILTNLKERFIFFLIICTSPFLIAESVFFRYYTYYFFSSTVILYSFFIGFKNLSTKQLLLFNSAGIIITPFIFFILNIVQFISHIIFTIFSYLASKKYHFYFLAFVCLISIYLYLHPHNIWNLFSILNINDHATFDESGELKGFGLATLLRPFYALFQMIFGYSITLLDSTLIITLYTVLAISIAFILYSLRENNKFEFNQVIKIAIVPVFIIFYLIEPMSPLGFPILFSKHVMFAYPVLIYIVITSYKHVGKNFYKSLIILFLISQIYGLSKYINSSLVNDSWDVYITDEIHQNFDDETLLIADDTVLNMLKFQIDKEINSMDILNMNLGDIKNYKNIYVALRDYKLYEILSYKNNWDQGIDTGQNIQRVNQVLDYIRNEYYLDSSYVEYPFFLYSFQKSSINNIAFSTWGHTLKDLKLPATILGDKTLMSSILLEPSQEYQLNEENYLIANLENTHSSNGNEVVGLLKCSEVSLELINNINIWDVFYEFNGQSPRLEAIIYSWKHKPLISTSIKYPGSWQNHNAGIYSIDLSFCDSDILLKNTSKNLSIRIWSYK